jgi:hypothetical protein
VRDICYSRPEKGIGLFPGGGKVRFKAAVKGKLYLYVAIDRTASLPSCNWSRRESSKAYFGEPARRSGGGRLARERLLPDARGYQEPP